MCTKTLCFNIFMSPLINDAIINLQFVNVDFFLPHLPHTHIYIYRFFYLDVFHTCGELKPLHDINHGLFINYLNF
jgi:hypothetical protein